MAAMTCAVQRAIEARAGGVRSGISAFVTACIRVPLTRPFLFTSTGAIVRAGAVGPQGKRRGCYKFLFVLFILPIE